jgi:hypothetical protein
MSRAAAASVQPLTDTERRALTEHILVLPPRLSPRYDVGSGLFHTIGESGAEYVTDPIEKSCTCPDAKYRDRVCKHIRRVQFETGERPVPAWADARAVPQFRRFVDERGPEDTDE